MALILDDLYGDIADAIREKEQSSSDISPVDFSERIMNLETKNNASKFPLVIHSVKGATITAVQDSTTITQVVGGGGTAVLWLPSPGEWNVTATKGSYTSSVVTITIDGNVGLDIDGLHFLDTELYLNEGQTGQGVGVVGNHILYAGGYISSSSKRMTDVVSYSNNLTRSLAPNLSTARSPYTSGNAGDFLIFGPGGSADTYGTKLDAYNSTLTKVAISDLTTKRENSGTMISIGNYALFSGGYYSSPYTPVFTVETYQGGSLAKSTASDVILSAKFASEMGGASTNTHGIFAGGGHQGGGDSSANVNAYSKSLTRSSPTPLSLARSRLGSVSSGNYAIFYGGLDDRHNFSKIVEAYDTSLTHRILSDLSITASSSRGVYFEEMYIMCMGHTGIRLDQYNKDLSKASTLTLPTTNRYCAFALDQYALLSGNNVYIDVLKG